MVYDLIIIGGGPAGIAAGIYAARKKIKALLITDSFGGQSVIAGEINNFIGIKSISGIKLKEAMEEHLRSYDIEIKEGSGAAKLSKENDFFSIITNKGEILRARTILVTAGSSPRKLGVPGEEKFEGKGVFYCSICDAPLLKNKIAVVIGGGNSGFYAVTDLMPYASKIYVIESSNVLRADPVYVDKIQKSGKVEIIMQAKILEIFGENFVSEIKYEDKKNGEIKNIKTDGVFVAIGYQPNSAIVGDVVKINEKGKIVVNHETQATSLEGVWAAGDITDVKYNQINIAIGDAVKAALNIYDYLKGIKK